MLKKYYVVQLKICVTLQNLADSFYVSVMVEETNKCLFADSFSQNIYKENYCKFFFILFKYLLHS